MLCEDLPITSNIEAIDVLSTIESALIGTSALALALSRSESYEPEAVYLISQLVDYCALGIDSTRRFLDRD